MPIKRCLLLTLVFASAFASCQGIGAGYAATESRSFANDVSNLEIDTPVLISGDADAESAGSRPLSSDTAPGLSVPGVVESAVSTQGRPDITNQWALQRIHAFPSAGGLKKNPPVLVAVLDTGIDKNHEELSGRVIAEIDLAGSSTTGDVYGHGTPIAGIIAADDDGPGIVGLSPESYLINVKVADDNGKCQLSALAEGIIWAVDNGAGVINISIELKESTPELQEAVDYAWNSGVVIVAAAGNDGDSRPVYPAAYENCIAVTALREDGTLAPLANYGDWVDVAAPGFNIYSILPDNGYGYKHGTSFAAAFVSGLAALLFPVMTDTNGDGWLNDEVRRAIESGCDAIEVDGTGQGLTNVAGSLAELP
jgi:thermitase